MPKLESLRLRRLTRPPEGSVYLGSSQDVGFVPSFVQTVQGGLMYKLCDSLLHLYPGASPRDKLLQRTLDGTHNAIGRIGSFSLRTNSGTFIL